MSGQPEVQSFYDHEAASYDARRWSRPAGRYTDSVQHAIVSELLGDAEGPFLELGIGTGRFGATLARPERPCVGVDIAHEMLLQTADRAQSAGQGGAVQLAQASGLELPFSDSAFPNALSINVMSHIPDAERALGELGRVVTPGGRLVVNFPNTWSPYLPYAMTVRRLRRSLLRGVPTRWYTPPEIKAALHSAGFEVEEARGQVHFPWLRGRFGFDVLRRLDESTRSGGRAWLGSIVFVCARRR